MPVISEVRHQSQPNIIITNCLFIWLANFFSTHGSPWTEIPRLYRITDLSRAMLSGQIQDFWKERVQIIEPAKGIEVKISTASRECLPPQPTGGSGGAPYAPQWDLGRTTLGRFRCSFMWFNASSVHLRAAWKWEIRTSLYRLVGPRKRCKLPRAVGQIHDFWKEETKLLSPNYWAAEGNEIKTSKASRERGMGKESFPPQPTGGSGGAPYALQWGLGRTILGRFRCSFMQFHASLVHLRAAWKWEIPVIG